MRWYWLGILAFLFVGYGCLGGGATATCQTEDQCENWQFCNTTAQLCQPAAGYCIAEEDCTNTLYTCDIETHACIVKPGMCEDDLDCQVWQVCSENTCRASVGFCDSSTQCDTRLEVCDPQIHQCVPKEGFCNSNFDCKGWEQCNVERKRCQLLPNRCNQDADCQAWQVCNDESHVCEASEGFCRNELDCPDWATCNLQLQKCVPRQGYCSEDNQCAIWEYCDSERQHICLPRQGFCSSNSDCDSWELCNNDHRCVPRIGKCSSDTDCPSGEICDERVHECR